ncbi:MAG: RNA 2',3'-cyclic phosphodiesterase [Gemmatimonadaceae bacterium]
MRLFIAINLTAEVQQAIDAVVAPIRDQAPSIRWVSVERLHVTLKFLGEQEAATVPALHAALDGVARTAPLGACRFTGFGVFPNFRAPRVVWIGVQAPGLVEFAGALDAALAPIGIAPEARRFAPHLTVGRVNQAVSPRERDDLRGWGAAIGEVAQHR